MLRPLGRRVMLCQARMTSTRLPGKVLRPIAGKPMLAWQLDQLAAVRNCDELVVAASTNPEDDRLESLCRERGVPCYRGSELDVLDRFAEAAKAFRADTVIRVCGDSPLIDPALVDSVIHGYSQVPAVDYASNTLRRTYPLGCHAEVFSAAVLWEAAAEARDSVEREHVTPFLYRRPERFRLRGCVQETDESHMRWTVDTPEDFEFVSRVLAALPAERPFHKADVLAVLGAHPGWSEINAHIEQVTVSQ